jgi:hypothetical protein
MRNRPRGNVAHVAHIERRVHDVLERWRKPLQQPLAGLGRRHAARRAVQQAHAELFLEVAHALTEARRRHPLLDGGAAEIALARHGDEGGEIA